MTDAPTDFNSGPTDSDAAYFAGVVAEIEAEAERRTADGDYPRALLRSLDEEFRRWIPDTGRASGIEDAIRSIEAAAYVDPGVPVESDRKVGVYVKTAVRKATYFYHRHMAQQIAALGIQVTRPMRLLDAATRQLDARIAALEDLADVNATARDELLAGLPDAEPGEQLLAEVARHMSGAPGRVVVAEVSDSGLVAHLVAQGVDAYGVGPGVDRHSTLELRDESLAEHLEALGDDTLGGVVLIGSPDRLALNEQLRLLGLIAGRAMDGARLAILVTDPDRWRDELGPVAADLMAGRPLHPETWAHLLERERATVAATHQATSENPVSGVLAVLHR